MKAIVYTTYGSPDVLQLKTVNKPVPKDNEVLIKIHATAVSSGDVHLRKADPFAVRLFFGLLRPKQPILGYVFAGEIEAVGKRVSRFNEGDQVYGTTGMGMGAYANYTCIHEDGVLANKPENMSYEEAAAVPFGGNTALYFLRKANIHSGQKVLVYGASGAIGTAAIQLSKHFGAEVTGVCSTANVDMVRALGADKVIDYTLSDFTKGDESYDIIFDTVGKSSFSGSRGALKKNGTLVLAAAGLCDMLRGACLSIASSRKVISGVMSEKAEDLRFFNELIESGKFKSVIDRRYLLEQVPEAHRYVEEGHKKGNVVITVAECNG